MSLSPDLIQIEEPRSRDSIDVRGGIAIGLELASDELVLAVSIGGNAELIRAPDCAVGLVKAVAGYGDGGCLVAGRTGLPGETWVGTDALLGAEVNLDLRRYLACVLTEAHRKLVQSLALPLFGAVIVAPSQTSLGSVVLQSAEDAGFDVLMVTDQEAARAAAASAFTADTPGLAALGAALIAEAMRIG